MVILSRKVLDEKFMNNRIKIILIFIIVVIVAVCGVFVLQKQKTNVENPQQEQTKIEAPQEKVTNPEVPQTPATTDENNVPKSDYKVPEIG